MNILENRKKLLADKLKEREKSLADAVHKFQRQYPKSDSGDLQTFVLGQLSCQEIINKEIEYIKDVMEKEMEYANLTFIHQALSECVGIDAEALQKKIKFYEESIEFFKEQNKESYV